MSKKILIGIIVMAIFAAGRSYAESSGVVKIGVDMLGKHEISGLGLEGSEDVKMGFSLSGEYTFSISKNFGIGAGITLQVPRSQKDFKGDFSFVPIYGLVKTRSATGDISPYLIGQLGYNLFQGDSTYTGTAVLSGGMYYGIGGGLILEDGFQGELLYSVNEGSAELLGYDFKVKYSKITFSIGYSF